MSAWRARRGRAEARPKAENLKKISQELRQHVLQLLDKKQVVERQVDRLTSKNDHLCEELAVIAELSEQLEKENELLLNTTDQELEEAKTQIRHQQNNIKKLEHTVKTLKTVVTQTENEISQGKSPSRLDTFIKTLEEDRDYYKSKAENLLRVFRNASSSPKRSSTWDSMSKNKSHVQGLSSDPDVLKILREHEGLESTVKKYERRVAEIQDSERLEQMSRMALLKEHIDSLETEVKKLARRSQDSETELSRQKADYISLSLMNEKTEQSLSEAQRSLIKKKYEMQLYEEKIRLLDEKINNFSKQSFAQEEKICALNETIVQLDKEKKTLQECVEEERKKTTTFEENLKIK
ncbi:hypothetical protein ASZ78_007689, partial [Callipepla squamata]